MRRSDLSPETDETTVRQFFDIIHEAAGVACAGMTDPGVLQLSRVHPSDDKLQVVGRFPIGDVDRMTAQAVADAAGGFNSYVEGRTVRAGLSRNERGKLADTVAVFALVVDADGDKGRDGVLPADVEPSLCVSSSPGNRHDWLFLTRALSADEAQAIGTALRIATGGDHDTGTVTQPYRVAGTPNFPGRSKVARGRVVESTSILTEGRRYEPNDLKQAFLVQGITETTTLRGPATGSDRPLDALFATLTSKRRHDLEATRDEIEAAGTDVSGHFMRVTGWLKGDGLSLEEAVELWAAFPESGPSIKYRGRIAAEVSRVWGKTTDETPAEREANIGGLLPKGANDDKPAPLRGTVIDFSVDRPFVYEPELVRDTLPQTGFAFIGGQSGTGKSFLVNALSMCLMTGESFAGRKIDRVGGVLVLASEGQGTMARRMKASRSRLSDPDKRLPIVAIGDFGPITKQADHVALQQRIRDVAFQMQADHGAPLVAFFLDTISAFQMIPDDRENDPAAWNFLMGNLKAISEDVGALAIGVHHYGKNATAGLRGSSAAWANADAVLAVSGDRDAVTGEVRDRALALVKNRDGKDGPIGAVTLEPVVIGQRPDGSEVSSLVFTVDTGIRIVSAGKRPAKPSKADKAFTDAFNVALLDRGQRVRVHGEASAPIVKAVPRVDARREFDLRYVTGHDDEKKRTDTLRKQFANGLERAEEAGKVASGMWGGIEWIWSLEADISAIVTKAA